ncbi:GrpB family protein [Staphylococcus debuckii]|uniref:GrpB family protein n=1 Tax=Staphylococcus debuckii TaxID=2044912 RepID=UPI000F4349B0|nr:GrpB family protein [Staphylococcus debuckii]AYU54564.1 GrpB family protein [Staphylococcus debuckii]
MYTKTQPLISDANLLVVYHNLFKDYEDLLFGLLNTPVKSVHHIGGTAHFNYATEPILDILVGVNNLHDITALDEKRLNYAGFYRIHHHYKKKVMMVKFNNLIELKQQVRLHILQIESKAYSDYLQMQDALERSNSLGSLFKEEKELLHASTQSIREYEVQKEKLFAKLSRQYLD